MSERPLVRIAFLDVGQGETTVVTLPDTGEAVVVDCLDAGNTIDYLRRQGIRHLRGVIITHLHLDHYGAVVQLLENCASELGVECERLIFNWVRSLGGDYVAGIQDDHSEGSVAVGARKYRRKKLLEQLNNWSSSNRKITRTLVSEAGGGELLPGGMNSVFDLVHPEHGQIGTLLATGFNNTSGVLRVRGVNSSALLTGDIEPPGWDVMRQNHPSLQSDVLSFPHHGAWRESDPSVLLSEVNPSFIVISVGTEGEQYGHPNLHVFEAIAARPNIRLMCTQVTRACGQRVREKRDAVVNQLRQHCDSPGRQMLVSRTGCPCAGTVIIELGEKASVIQPEAGFHRDAIIKPNFSDHCCRV